MNSMEKWPNFFIVGTTRAGTTSLWQYLQKIPGVYMSPVKEPDYFNPNTNYQGFSTIPIRDKKKYLELFKDVKDETAIGEASPTYLADPQTPYLIHDVIPNARIIIMLRDPVERAFSEYLLMYAIGVLKCSFSELIHSPDRGKKETPVPIVEYGLYYEKVKRNLEVFGPDQVRCYIFEEFVKDPIKTLKEILDFLKVKNPVINFELEVHNPTIVYRNRLAKFIVRNKIIRKVGKHLPRNGIRQIKWKLTKPTTKPSMAPEDRKFLQEFYREDIPKLENLLGRKMPWKCKNYSSIK